MTPLILTLKLLLSPSLVLLAWWLGRRWGPAIGGRAAALPIVAGPILLVLALTHGNTFASQAAKFALVGIGPLALFGVVYAGAARLLPLATRRARVVAGILSGWAGFVGLASGVQTISAAAAPGGPAALPLLACAGAALLTLLVAPRLIVTVPADHQATTAHHLSREVGGRVLGAMLLVGTLTSVAATLGAAWSGLLASFPVALSVVVVAAHVSDGPAMVRPIFHGYLHGLYGYLAFLTLFAWLLPLLGLGWTLLISWPAAPLVQWLHHAALNRRRPA